MNLFSKKISKDEIALLIYQIGYERYLFLKKQFENQLDFKDSLLYVLTIIVSSSLTKRILEFNNSILNYDIVTEVDKFVYDSIPDENDKINYCQYYVYIRDEIWNIINNDSSDMVLNLSNYFINEITEDQNTDYEPSSYMINILTNWHFETKNLLKQLKII